MPDSIFAPEVQAVMDQARRPAKRTVAVDGRQVTIDTPFPSPGDWRDLWIYQILVDRFDNPAAPPRHPWDSVTMEFQGGTLAGVRARLDYLRQLGAGAIWLSPLQKNCQYNSHTHHGYGFQDFLRIDPRFASDPQAARRDPRLAEDELRALVDEIHARGMYVIFDIVLNHAGDVFEYEGARHLHSQREWRDHPYQIFWRDADGRGRDEWHEPPADALPDAALFPLELRRNELFRRRGMGGELGGDFATLKELATDYQEHSPAYGRVYPARRALIRIYQYLMAKFDVDGYRIDTLKYIEPDFARAFGNAMREFAHSIGKRDFFTFGEVYDEEDRIAAFIGRNSREGGDLIGVDAALDFPLFFRLPQVVKGQRPPTDIIAMYEYRKEVERGLVSSHGEASKFFVTFLDNHDQHRRFYYVDPADPARYDAQATLGLGLLFTLQGIPCLYYGTEQGLHGAGEALEAVREALWGKPGAFDRDHPFYRAVERLSHLRAAQPPLRFGRQYFRPISGDGVNFGASPFRGGVLAFSRLLADREMLVVANTSPAAGWSGLAIVDYAANPPGTPYRVLFSNQPEAQVTPPAPVVERAGGSVVVHEVTGGLSHGPARAVGVTLRPMEIQVLAR
ncbi:MAG TPA: alpha-amylase family glycosyl hydrolase [Roseiflexaceae bacterium]|nr:alpha-amylase family glycosyl hydrolase [Roseiflexaceae bacterium]